MNDSIQSLLGRNSAANDPFALGKAFQSMKRTGNSSIQEALQPDIDNVAAQSGSPLLSTGYNAYERAMSEAAREAGGRVVDQWSQWGAPPWLAAIPATAEYTLRELAIPGPGEFSAAGNLLADGAPALGALLWRGADGVVDALPTDQASRMARAREQGFMTDDKGDLLTVYHATNAPEEALIEGFDPDVVSRSEFDRVGTWFEGSPDGSEVFAHYGGNVIPAHIKMQNPLVVESDKTLLGRMNPDNVNYEDWLSSQKGMDVMDTFDMSEAEQLSLETEYRNMIETAWERTIPDLRAKINAVDEERAGLRSLMNSDDFKKLSIDEIRELKKKRADLDVRRADLQDALNEAEVYDGLNTYIRYFEGQTGADTSKFGMDRWREGAADRFRELLENQGYDGVVVKNHFGDNNTNPRTWYIVPPAKGDANIRSIHAKFDPSKKDSRNLLAGIGTGAIGASYLLGNESQPGL